MIRIFDLFFSILGLILTLPLFLILALWIKIDSSGPVFYRQIRVGKGNVDFFLLKFRSMKSDSDSKGLITIGNRDPRITRSGYFIRKYKLDELPQLINVISGDMSIVGPRPEVRKYVDLYSEEQKEVLLVRPGITDYASIAFRNENNLLSQVSQPEEHYIKYLIPEKIRLNLIYIHNPSLYHYFRIILFTAFPHNNEFGANKE